MGNCFGDYAKKEQHYNHTTKQIVGRKPTKQQLDWRKLLHIHQVPNLTWQYGPVVLQHPCFAQIDKDIDRTYPDQPLFKQAQNRQAFRNTLRRLALHLPTLGYTQGMNFVAGYFFIYGMKEAQSFEAFLHLMIHPQLLLMGLYQEGYLLVKLYIAVFWALLRKRLPLLAAKIEQVGLLDQLWIFQWFLSLFVYSLPIQYIRQLMTFVFHQKYFALVKLAMSITNKLANKLNINAQDQQFQDQFVIGLQKLKDINYCSTTLPLRDIVDSALLITDQQIYNLNVQLNNNRYFDYFIGNKTKKQKGTIKQQTNRLNQQRIYGEWMAEKQKERLQFVQNLRKNMGLRSYQRIRSSVCILEEIQDNKQKKYFVILSKTQKQRQLVRSNFMPSLKKVSSSAVAHGNYTLVQSVTFG